jgi:hypothetical protein
MSNATSIGKFTTILFTSLCWISDAAASGGGLA